MFRFVEDFLNDWGQESASTLKIMNCLTDDCLSRNVTPKGRNLGDLAWHIAFSLGEMPSTAGLPVPVPDEEETTPETAGLIIEVYEKNAAALSVAVKENWDDDSLDEEVEAYGENWSKGAILDMLVKHEIHHRAQMTVLMRQAGIRIPGIYGPTREEWADYGLPPRK